MKCDLTKTEIGRLLDAVESHIYWQLTDPLYRNNGYSFEPYSDDWEDKEQIKKFQQVQKKLERFANPT